MLFNKGPDQTWSEPSPYNRPKWTTHVVVHRPDSKVSFWAPVMVWVDDLNLRLWPLQCGQGPSFTRDDETLLSIPCSPRQLKRLTNRTWISKSTEATLEILIVNDELHEEKSNLDVEDLHTVTYSFHPFCLRLVPVINYQIAIVGGSLLISMDIS